jgi:hypothetical protein
MNNDIMFCSFSYDGSSNEDNNTKSTTAPSQLQPSQINNNQIKLRTPIYFNNGNKNNSKQCDNNPQPMQHLSRFNKNPNNNRTKDTTAGLKQQKPNCINIKHTKST